MKKFLFSLILINICSLGFAERIYKTFIINGVAINKWVDISNELCAEYDSNNNIIKNTTYTHI